MKRTLLLFLILTLFFTGTVRGEDTSAAAGSSEGIFRQLQINREDPYGFRPGSVLAPKDAAEEVKYPASYDLRHVDTDGDGIPDTSYVTPVKFQNPFGTCWGFSAIAAAESAVISSGLAKDMGLAAAADPAKGLGELNLSEKHLAYFMSQPNRIEGDPQYGEGIYYHDNGKGAADIYNLGGNPPIATSLFASGTGPVRESADEIYEYHGKDKKIQYEVINGETVPYCYSADDNWEIRPDNDYRWKQHFVLSESFIMPSPSAIITSDTLKQEEKELLFKTANNAIKDQLMAGRAVMIAFTADTSRPNEAQTSKYISLENWAHYTYVDNSPANHAVTIIGWDDNYPAENFAHKIQRQNAATGEIWIDNAKIPEHDGAWLVKNSWGSLENEFPNRGRGWGLLQGQDKGVYNETTGKYEYKAADGAVNTGYFWLSYEDRSLIMPEALAFDQANKMDGYWLQEHDFMPAYTTLAGEDEELIMMANVFTAEEDSLLEYVSCQTTYPFSVVNYDVYRLDDTAKSTVQDPVRGEPIAQASTAYIWGGYHKIRLDRTPLLQKGERFAVVVTQKTVDNKYTFNIPANVSEAYCNLDPDNTQCHWGRAVVNEGESLLYKSGKWSDLSAIREELIKSQGENLVPYYVLDNFSIKAYLAMQDPEYVEPKAIPLIYTGSPLPLVEPGKMISEGTLYYAPGTAEGPTEKFSTSVPSAVGPGTYYVWYFINGENVRRSTKPQCIVVTISNRLPGCWKIFLPPWI